MEKYTVLEASKLLGISKEAIYNRIRREALRSETIDGIKYVLIEEEQINQLKKSTKKPKSTKMPQTQNRQDDEYLEFLKTHVKDLNEKIKTLEEDKNRLIKEKEDLLIQSKIEIEKIHASKDLQLRNVLSTMSAISYQKEEEPQEAEPEEAVIEEYKEETNKEETNKYETEKEMVFYKSYFLENEYSKEDMKKFKKYVKKKLKGKDNYKGVLVDDGIIYLPCDFELNKFYNKG